MKVYNLLLIALALLVGCKPNSESPEVFEWHMNSGNVNFHGKLFWFQYSWGVTKEGKIKQNGLILCDSDLFSANDYGIDSGNPVKLVAGGKAVIRAKLEPGQIVFLNLENFSYKVDGATTWSEALCAKFENDADREKIIYPLIRQHLEAVIGK